MKKLSYKSIADEVSTPNEIRDAIRHGTLICFKPALDWVPEPRVVLMTTHLKSQIDAGIALADSKASSRWEKLQADISYFVEGGLINWGFMKWLDPKKNEHWTLKSVRPRPSLRMFGRFAMPNVFVGTHVVARSQLKGKWSIEWELEKLNCEDHWKMALGTFLPFSANKYEGYITDNATRNVRIGP